MLDGDPTNYSLDDLKLVPYEMEHGAVMNRQRLHSRGNKQMNEAVLLMPKLIIKKSTLKKGNINEK